MPVKKRFFFIFIFFIILLVSLDFLSDKFLFSFFAQIKNAKMNFFVKEKINQADEYVGLFFLTDNLSEADEEDALGEMALLDMHKTSLLEIKNFFNAKVVALEEIGCRKIYYLYSGLLKKRIETGKKVFNLQVIIDENEIKICYPINFAGF